MTASRIRVLHFGAAGSLVALILLCLLWELALAPLRPGGSWLVLKVLPLLFPLRGVLKRDVYTMQWSSMLILLYFGEGIVRTSLAITLGWVEVALSVVYFVCAMLYLYPYKKAAKELARQAIQKASR